MARPASDVTDRVRALVESGVPQATAYRRALREKNEKNPGDKNTEKNAREKNSVIDVHTRKTVLPIGPSVPITFVEPALPTGVLIPSTPFAGLQSFLIKRDGRGFTLVIEYRADGEMHTAGTWHATFEEAVRALRGRWA